VPHPNRNSERSGNYSSFRSGEFENASKFEYRDENQSRPVEVTSATEEVPVDPQLLLDELKDKNNYNPKVVDLNKATAARYIYYISLRSVFLLFIICYPFSGSLSSNRIPRMISTAV